MARSLLSFEGKEGRKEESPRVLLDLGCQLKQLPFRRTFVGEPLKRGGFFAMLRLESAIRSTILCLYWTQNPCFACSAPSFEFLEIDF